tara:strand:- start:4120 stop:5355 length:1236 start_codon:yes stop_codon:yes gene_type:complete
MFRGGSVDSYGTGIASGLGTRSQYRNGGVSYNPYNKAQTSNLLGRNTPKVLPDMSQFGESKITSIFNPVQITPQGFQKSSPMPGSDELAMLMKNLYPGSAYGEPISEEDIEESLEQGQIFDNYGTASSIRRGEGEKLEPSSRIEEGLFGSGVFDEEDKFREREATRIPFDNVQELRDEPASTSPELEAIRQENIDKIDSSPKKVETPNVNETDETEVTMTDLEKALGLDKARRRDLGDMLGRASAAFLGTGDVREGLSEFMAAEVKAGPSRTERIKSIAGLEEFKAKKAQELYEAKLTATLKQKQGTKGSLQKDIEYLGTLSGADRIAALGKLGYKAPSLSAAIKELKITGQAPDPATIINLATLYIGPDFQGVVDVTEEMSGKAAGTYITTDATALIIVDEQGNTRLQKL